jgi:hypothetical protein
MSPVSAALCAEFVVVIAILLIASIIVDGGSVSVFLERIIQ